MISPELQKIFDDIENQPKNLRFYIKRYWYRIKLFFGGSV